MRGHTLQENTWQLSIALQLNTSGPLPLPGSFVCFELWHVLWLMSQPLWVRRCNCSSVSKAKQNKTKSRTKQSKTPWLSCSHLHLLALIFFPSSLPRLPLNSWRRRHQLAYLVRLGYCSLEGSQLCRTEDCSSPPGTCTASSSTMKASPYEASRYHQLAFCIFYDSRMWCCQK